MIITQDISLMAFKPWAGAKDVFKRLTIQELETLETILTDIKETWDETELNDTLWFEDEWICKMLGINNEEFWKREA